MANIESKKKRHIQDEKKRVLNHSKNSEVRTRVKKIKVSGNSDDLSKVYSVIDKSVKTNRIHKNKANRMKSRISLKLNSENSIN